MVSFKGNASETVPLRGENCVMTVAGAANRSPKQQYSKKKPFPQTDERVKDRHLTVNRPGGWICEVAVQTM